MLVDSKRVVEFVSFVQEPVGIDFVLDFTAFVHVQEVVASSAEEGGRRRRTDTTFRTISGNVALLEGAGRPGSFGGAAHLRGQRVLS